MNVESVIKKLKRKYPGRTIIENKNEQGITTEVVCEVEPTSDHPEYSVAIAVIDYSTIHYHKKITETYKVLKGELKMFKYDKNREEYKEYVIKKGESIVIKPGEIHLSRGDEAWVEVVSNPGWLIDDYYNLEVILKKYVAKEDK
jgi:mannose-6-phosphate isomerase-like protein (cupin superfamily)